MADKTIGTLDNLIDIADDVLLVVEHNGKAFNLAGAQWKAYAVKAAQGVNKGDKGDPGVSPTVAIAAIVGGHRLTITDAGGTETADIMDGVDGDDGVSPTVSVTTTADGHRVTITDRDGSTSFDVTDGRDGLGAGDMLASVYDPGLTVKTAGGIAAYVTAQIGDALEGSY